MSCRSSGLYGCWCTGQTDAQGRQALMSDPLVGSRGLVPKDDFEEFTKGGRTTSQGGQTRSSQPSR